VCGQSADDATVQLPAPCRFGRAHAPEVSLSTAVSERDRCGLPVADAHWAKGGCTSTIAATQGARIRHTLDRDSEAYKDLYALRTMVERINSQAEALDIIHPKLRHGSAIVNRNTLTYVLINLRALKRVRERAAKC
jgi:hypothetical protein